MNHEFPEIGGFSQFFKGRARFSDALTNVIADAYSWSTKLDPTCPDNLPLPFVSNNDEVVWSYLKHQNKQLDTFNRKFKGFLDEMVGKDDIKLTKKVKEDSSDEDDFEDEEDDEEDIDMDDEEDEEDVDLLNLKEEDLKDLEKELNEMEDEDDDDEEAEEKKKTIENLQEKKKFKKSVVDDQFFCLDEMRNFLEISERGDGRLQEDMMFEDDADWDGKTAYQYEDFFGSRAEVENEKIKEKKKDKKRKRDEKGDNEMIKGEDESIDDGKQKKRVRFAMDEEDEEDEIEEDIQNEENDEIKDGPVLLGANLEEEKEVSGFAKRQKKMKEKISKLEEENLAPRSWELSGEVAGEQREKNTLLEQPVDFDHGAKRAPEVTEEFTDKLEALIKQRIRDKTFDDVVRVTKIEEKGPRFDTTPLEEIHNQKTSLAEVYEKEYQKKVGEAGDGKDSDAKNEAHEKIKSKMTELFGLIDALTHFEYRPAEAKEDVKIVSNMASLRVEEVGAMASSEAQLMAPEEVAKREKGEVKGEDEREKTDKLRERRKKKAKQRDMVAQLGEDRALAKQKALKLKEKKEKEGGNEKIEKVKSSNFFSKLQDTVQQEKRDGKKKKVIKRLKTDKNSAAIKL